MLELSVETHRRAESFNGAAFFQSGKCVVIVEAVEDKFCFNGAAFFQSGKYADGVRIAAFFGGLQWSRFFSKRKTPGL